MSAANGNKVCGRICVSIYGKLGSPLLAGSGENLHTDMDVILDSEAAPFLPGSALAGSLRSYMKKVMEESDLISLFGGDRKSYRSSQLAPEQEERQSRLYVYDVLLENAHVIRRDGVRLGETKTVSDSAKFSVQAIEKGADFRIRMEILERERELKKCEALPCLQKVQETDCMFVTGILRGMINGEVRVGAKSHRGFGKLEVSGAKIARFDLESQKDYTRWLDWDWDREGVFLEDEKEDLTKILKAGERLEHCLTVPLKISNTILIRQYTDIKFGNEDVADAEQLCINGKDGVSAVIPGSSWSGAVRGRIAEFMTALQKDLTWESAQKRLTRFFGTWTPDKERQKCLQASKLIFEESIVNGGQSLPVVRNAIDRFTGGTIHGALYQEVLWVGGCLNMVIRWPVTMEHQDILKGLLFWAISDLQSGFLAVGGETAAGRGILEKNGEAQLDGENVTDWEKCEKAALLWCRREGTNG